MSIEIFLKVREMGREVKRKRKMVHGPYDKWEPAGSHLNS